MAYAHIAHDCRLMDGVIIVNSVSVAGHVTIHDHAIVGGLAGVHQFVNMSAPSLRPVQWCLETFFLMQPCKVTAQCISG